MQKLDQLNFENTFARLPDTFHSRLHPTPLPDPYLVSFNADAARLIDLDTEKCRAPISPSISSATACCRAPSRWPCSTPATSSATSCRNWATGARSCSARSGTAPASLGRTAQGRRHHALFAQRRRPRRAAFQHPRIPVLGSHARPGHPHHPRAVHRRQRRGGVSRTHRNRRRAHTPGAFACALRLVRGVLTIAASMNRSPGSPTTSSPGISRILPGDADKYRLFLNEVSRAPHS